MDPLWAPFLTPEIFFAVWSLKLPTMKMSLFCFPSLKVPIHDNKIKILIVQVPTPTYLQYVFYKNLIKVLFNSCKYFENIRIKVFEIPFDNYFSVIQRTKFYMILSNFSKVHLSLKFFYDYLKFSPNQFLYVLFSPNLPLNI